MSVHKLTQAIKSAAAASAILVPAIVSSLKWILWQGNLMISSVHKNSGHFRTAQNKMHPFFRWAEKTTSNSIDSVPEELMSKLT
jgi:hypothetical protein